ncbi:MAG: hypothetical protein A2Y41_01445 [Spirochaetes bacterium GWB1_36_13]|nr:MAG: hypothetical protein A2Y41_01445 [Spirochaetes bacterium GWB1_36_13]
MKNKKSKKNLLYFLIVVDIFVFILLDIFVEKVFVFKLLNDQKELIVQFFYFLFHILFFFTIFFLLKKIEKEKNQKIYETKLFYQNIVDHYGDIVFKLNRENFRIDFINQSGKHLLGLEKIDQISFLDIVYADDRERISSFFLSLSEDLPFNSVDIRILSKTNELIWIECLNQGFFDQTGNLIQIQSIGRIITHQKKLFEALIQSYESTEKEVIKRTHELQLANKKLEEENMRRIQIEQDLKSALKENEQYSNDLEQFNYSASHDLQEPVRMISVYAKLLIQKFKNQFSDEVIEHLNYIIYNSDKMKNLIFGFSNYAQIQKRSENKTEVDLNKILDSITQKIKEECFDIKLNLLVAPLPVLQGDYFLFFQLFENLIKNAIDFKRKENIKIIVKVKEEDAFYQFSIEDNGIGIDKEYFSKIFQFFHKLNPKNNEKTGLGLSVCKKIAEVYGGKIWLESEKGKGSIFYFTLPKP